MKFWGLEVKAGASLKVNPDPDRLIHISQASLDKGEEGEEGQSAHLYVTLDGKKVAIGTLPQYKVAIGTLSQPQISLDLDFEKEFELFHSLKSGSVHFIGYSTPASITPFSSKNAKPRRTGKRVLVHFSESIPNLKKQKIHKEKSEEIKKLKKSIKELSEATKDLQEIQTTKADLLKLELTGSALDGEPVVEEEGEGEESVPDAAYSQTAEGTTADMFTKLNSNISWELFYGGSIYIESMEQKRNGAHY